MPIFHGWNALRRFKKTSEQQNFFNKKSFNKRIFWKFKSSKIYKAVYQKL